MNHVSLQQTCTVGIESHSEKKTCTVNSSMTPKRINSDETSSIEKDFFFHFRPPHDSLSMERMPNLEQFQFRRPRSYKAIAPFDLLKQRPVFNKNNTKYTLTIYYEC